MTIILFDCYNRADDDYTMFAEQRFEKFTISLIMDQMADNREFELDG